MNGAAQAVRGTRRGGAVREGASQPKTVTANEKYRMQSEEAMGLRGKNWICNHMLTCLSANPSMTCRSRSKPCRASGGEWCNEYNIQALD